MLSFYFFKRLKDPSLLTKTADLLKVVTVSLNLFSIAWIFTNPMSAGNTPTNARMIPTAKNCMIWLSLS